MTQTFFIADTHFGHENIIRFENRPYANTQEMDQALIANWNTTVGEKDTIFILGDFAITEKAKIKEIIASLSGYKILILGNHDKALPYHFWLESGMDEVSSYPMIYKEWFILSHEPVYINNNMPYRNIYGHVHANPTYKDVSAKSHCVSAERIHYSPISFERILEEMKQATK